ncbi:MAG TPA: hypothetical protein VN634_15985 [Candidatus Limnocylindrales bacterium]|nr:hypothetical protein [Candidatus Limnocylindrales bacterium]
MKNSLSIFFLMFAVVALPGSSSAGGKADGRPCHVSKSCRSNYCITLHPEDKFGVCCTPQGCPEPNAQCGTIGNACGVPIECGPCDPGSTCVNNQCVPASTTTTTTSTTSTTMCTELACGNLSLCGEGAPGSCFVVQTPETGACTPNCVNNADCQTLTACTATTDCAPGQVCAIKTCCGEAGVCATPCGQTPPSTSTTTSSTTTTTSTTSTTLGFPKSCVGFCNTNSVPPGDGADCFCNDIACFSPTGCADFFTACPFVCD